MEHQATGSRRTHARHPLLIVAIGLLLLLVPVLDSVALGVEGQSQQRPTEEPADPPAIATLPGGLPIQLPTPTPTPRARVTPTPDPPSRATEIPTREPGEPTTEPTATEPIAQAAELDPASLTIHKGTCNLDYQLAGEFDPYADATLADFQAECPAATDPVEFTVTGEDGFAATVATTAGVAQLNVPFTKIAITETLPPGHAYPAVFCHSNFKAPIADSPPAFWPTASWTTTPGELLECWFFNIPMNDRLAVTLVKVECPGGVSPLSDQLDPFAYCTTTVPGIEFTLTDANGERSQVTDEDGMASWDDTILRDDDTIAIRETIPDGYGEPAFFCEPKDDSPGNGTYIPSVNGAITLPLTDTGQHASVHCVVFNTTIGADSGHDITIFKLSCPFGYDATGANLETLLDDCPNPPDTVPFTITGSDGFNESGQTTSADLPFLSFDNVPAGTVTITESVPPGYQLLAVWCTDDETDTTGATFTSQTIANGSAIAWDYAEGSRLRCIWLNIATEDVPIGDNQVIVHKWRCNIEDLGAYDTDWELDEYLATCDEAMDGVDFTLTSPAGASSKTTSGGTVTWTNLPDGDFTIQETIPQYHADPIVFCSIQIPNGGGPMVRVESSGGLVEASFGVPGSTYTCEWFNVDVGENSMRFFKHICPVGVEMGQALDSYEQTCTVPGPNIEFTVTTIDGTVTSSTNFSGVIVFQPVAAGNVTAQETIPPGYGSPLVFCSTSVHDGSAASPFAEVASVNGLVELTMPALGHIDCHWYNIPANPGTVTIHKWECPETPPKGTIVTWYPENCTQAMDGIQFTLETVSGNSTGITTNGSLTFQDVPNGPVGIQETIPPGFGEPFISCDLDGAPVLESAVNGHYATDLGGGQTLTCHVYNKPGGPGDLTFVKHTCPPGYDPFVAGADPEADCPELTNGVAFTLSGPADALSTTGDVGPGTAYFGPLDPGIYTVTETVPDGTALVFIPYCTGHIMGQLQPYPLSQDESLDIAVDAGEHLTCHWYNVPAAGGGTVTLTKHLCDGATFVSEVDCEIYEGGTTFDLILAADGTVVATGTTDGVGRISWSGLAPGDYWLVEHGGTWCHIAATPSEGGDSFGVNDGLESTVAVYNCGAEPGQPGDTPTKYPNTGVGEEASGMATLGQQAVSSGQQDRGVWGKASAVLGILLLAARFVTIVQRGREQREERDAGEQAAEQFADKLARDRAAWLADRDTRTSIQTGVGNGQTRA